MDLKEKMKSQYLKSFVIGSSAPVVFPFFWGVSKFLPEKKFSYVNYSFKAPAYFGLTNMLSLYLAKKFNLSAGKRFLLMSQVSPLFVSSWITAKKAYDFPTKKRWLQQYALLWLVHGITWLATIQYLENNV